MDTSRFHIRVLCFVMVVAGWSVSALGTTPASGQYHSEAGHFFIEAIAPTDYPGGTQNWAILQDQDGILYVANNDGVMVYDGEHWDLIKMPNDSGVRSLVRDAEGRIFVGAQDELGYLAPDDVGSLQFVSLLPELGLEDVRFGDIRSMAVTPEGVYFQTASYLYRWTEEGSLDAWEATGQFGNIFSIDEVLYVHQYEQGLMTMASDSLELLEGTEHFADNRLQALTRISEDTLLLGTFEGELFTLTDGELSPFEVEIAAYVREHDLYRIEKLSDGLLVIGTIRAGALLVRPDGQLVRKIGRDDGLPGVTVLSVYEDDRGGVWLGFNAGLARIDVPFAFTRYNYRLGLEGIGVSITRHEGRLYVASTSGVFALHEGEGGEPARFRHVENTQQQCFDTLSTHSGLLVSCGNGVLRVEGDEAVMVAEGLIAYTLYQSRLNEDVVYLGLLDGVGWLRMEEDEDAWVKQGRIDELDEPVRNIVEDRDGNLWLGTDYQGVLRVSFEGDIGEGTAIRRYGTAEGVPGGNTLVNKIGDEIIVSTSEGFQRVRNRTAEDGTRTYVIERHSELTDLLPDGFGQVGLIHEGVDGRLWLFAQNLDGRGSAVLLVRRNEDGSFVQEHTPLLRVSGADMYAQYVGDDDRVWLSTQDGLIRYDETVPGAYFADFSVHLRGVRTIGTDSLLYGGSGSAAAAVDLPHNQNGIRFTFAAPTFNRGAPMQYRVWLDGFDSDWSAWTEETRRDYTNLPGGEYTFHVQAKNAYGLLSDEATYSFAILNPWYDSWWAIAGFIGGMLFLLAGVAYSIYWYRARQLRERNRVLEQRVRERTHALRKRTRTLERANLELRTANEQKSEFLGVAAHDLKNPLSGIIKTASFLIEDARTLDDEPLRKLVQEFVPLIHDSSTRMLQIIDDLLHAHVLEEEQNELYLERVDMAQLVYSVLRWNRTQAENKGITLYFRPPERCEAMVDETQMQRVLDNLISNAIKFSPKGSAVQVRLEGSDDLVRISVSDQGPGLTETDKKKVFGKLQLLSAKPTGGEHSSGLGLFIVKELVENHDGKVHVESEYGKGATFIVEIPTRFQKPAVVVEEQAA